MAQPSANAEYAAFVASLHSSDIFQYHSCSSGWQVNFPNSHTVAGMCVNIYNLMPHCGTRRVPQHVSSATPWAHIKSKFHQWHQIATARSTTSEKAFREWLS